jgi:hypothetical protein
MPFIQIIYGLVKKVAEIPFLGASACNPESII